MKHSGLRYCLSKEWFCCLLLFLAISSMSALFALVLYGLISHLPIPWGFRLSIWVISVLCCSCCCVLQNTTGIRNCRSRNRTQYAEAGCYYKKRFDEKLFKFKKFSIKQAFFSNEIPTLSKNLHFLIHEWNLNFLGAKWLFLKCYESATMWLYPKVHLSA